MFCSANCCAILNCLVSLCVFGLVWYTFEEVGDVFFWLILMKIFVKLLTSYLSCFLVSRNQNVKTMKSLVTQNTKSN